MGTYTPEEHEAGLHNLSELLAMKDPRKYTAVEDSLARFLDWYYDDKEPAVKKPPFTASNGITVQYTHNGEIEYTDPDESEGYTDHIYENAAVALAEFFAAQRGKPGGIEYRIVGPNSVENPFTVTTEEEARKRLQQYQVYALYGHAHRLQRRTLGIWEIVE